MSHTLIQDERIRQMANEFAQRMATVEATVERARIAHEFWTAIAYRANESAVSHWLGELDGTIELLDRTVAPPEASHETQFTMDQFHMTPQLMQIVLEYMAEMWVQDFVQGSCLLCRNSGRIQNSTMRLNGTACICPNGMVIRTGTTAVQLRERLGPLGDDKDADCN